MDLACHSHRVLLHVEAGVMLWIQIAALIFLAAPSVLLMRYLDAADRFDLDRRRSAASATDHEDPIGMRRAA
jgi:hypothetical protein